MLRATPLDLVFSPFAGTVFPAIQQTIGERGIEPTDRDAFLLVPDAVSLIRDLRPEEGLGEGVEALVALVQHAYLVWDAGSVTVILDPAELDRLLGTPPSPLPPPGEAPRAYYVQCLEHEVWATVLPGEPAEPLDGCFVHVTPAGLMRVLGVFGLRAGRAGFTAAEVAGERPDGLARVDGAPLFASTLAAGRLHAIAGGEELLEFGWRTLGPARETAARVPS